MKKFTEAADAAHNAMPHPTIRIAIAWGDAQIETGAKAPCKKLKF